MKCVNRDVEKPVPMDIWASAFPNNHDDDLHAYLLWNARMHDNFLLERFGSHTKSQIGSKQKKERLSIRKFHNRNVSHASVRLIRNTIIVHIFLDMHERSEWNWPSERILNVRSITQKLDVEQKKNCCRLLEMCHFTHSRYPWFWRFAVQFCTFSFCWDIAQCTRCTVHT